jgi:enamine deaminase RidA (YjgF/YER057c/UK114 family)
MGGSSDPEHRGDGRQDLAEVVRLAGDPPSPWEEEYGFCRVLRAGPLVIVAGTTSVDPSGVILGTSPYQQAVEILAKIAREMGRAGATLADVIQTRVYTTDISRHGEIGRAHREAFGERRPTMTMVEVSGLVDPRMLVEIEALAWVGERPR